MTAQLEQNQVKSNMNTPDNSENSVLECGDLNNGAPNSYAGAAGGNKHVLTFHLESDKKNFFMTVKEIATLVYNRLMAPPKSLHTFDDTAYAKLTVELHGWVDLGELNLTTALQIRDDLKTKPFKREIPEKKVSIYWAPRTLSNEKIQEKLESFGKINCHVGVVNKIYRATEDDDPITAMMDGVTLPDREVYMAVLCPIPSHILVDGIKIKIVYQGQARTCARCFRFWGQCPGKGNSAECKKLMEEENKKKAEKGEKVVKAPSLKKKMSKLEKTLEEKMKIANQKHDIQVKNKPVPSLILISGLPKEITLPQLMNLFKKNNCIIESLDDKLELKVDSTGNGIGQAIMTGLDEIDWELVREQMDGVYIANQRLKVTAVQEVTPKKPEPEPEDDAMQTSPPSSPATASPPTTASPPPTDPSQAASGSGSFISNLVQKFSGEPPRTAGGSKIYPRLTESGNVKESRKSTRKSTDDESSPKLGRGGDHNVSKRSKNTKNNKNSK